MSKKEMKHITIQLDQLDPNPFRTQTDDVITGEEIARLMASINQTGFWDNLLARKKNDRYQLAYGHKRLAALRQLGYQEITIPVRDIDDATMIRILANENATQGDLRSATIIETVKVAQTFLKQEWKKYSTYKEAKENNSFTTSLVTNPQAWGHLKNGIGTDVISRFLGWPRFRIEIAIATDRDINKNAIKILTKPGLAGRFITLVRKLSIPKKEQERIAKALVERKFKGGTANLFAEVKTIAPSYFQSPDIQISEDLQQLEKKVNHWLTQLNALRRASTEVNVLLRKLHGQQIEGYHWLTAMENLTLLGKELIPILKVCGISPSIFKPKQIEKE